MPRLTVDQLHGLQAAMSSSGFVSYCVCREPRTNGEACPTCGYLVDGRDEHGLFPVIDLDLPELRGEETQ